MSCHKIVLVDDQTVFRNCMAHYFNQQADFEVIQEIGTGPEAVALAESLKPDAIIMDVYMPEGAYNGLEATRRIKVICPDTRVLIITNSTHEDDLHAAIAANADGFAYKNMGLEEFINGVRKMCTEGIFFSPQNLARIAKRIKDMTEHNEFVPPSMMLTGREQEILELIRDGRSDTQIASALFISAGTVRYHVDRIFSKLSVESRTAAVVKALRKRVIEL